MHRATISAVAAALAVSCSAQSPDAVYNGGFNNTNGTIKLRIGNGGAGQSGLVGLLADEFVKDSVKNGSEPFSVAWYTSDTTYSIEYLKTGLIDVGITYSPAAEQIAVNQGIAKEPIYYAFRDHFLFVGPAANPANISGKDDITTIFSDLHAAAESDVVTDPSIKFLSRFDKSATNIKESVLWAGIGQALTAAIWLQEYTITDRGTILSLDAEMANRTVIYKAGTNDAEDPLLNPAHLLVGAKAPNPERAVAAFAEWVISDRGQDVIANFEKNGEKLYSAAPSLQSNSRRKRHALSLKLPSYNTLS
ncbi:putative extracellular tungstate binding protein [Xylaria bambusicola]|uniref:putative extracellular tungstate binding protein n=1 Tax=Xylaria bambusicola TaxID=326684 RepID=UPI002007BCF8|nr:putative extracellular tungstate binding protein [Xylaria bambusicola]KAI0518097.1 putative extracellular tungstate binding protein [Xylaria bambusicola]